MKKNTISAVILISAATVASSFEAAADCSGYNVSASICRTSSSVVTKSAKTSQAKRVAQRAQLKQK